MFSGYGEFCVSVGYKQLPQTIRINFEIFSSQAQFDHNLPDAYRTEEQTVLRR